MERKLEYGEKELNINSNEKKRKWINYVSSYSYRK
jgi:hypothetical protein